MDYNQYLDTALERLHEEGRYRTFIDIERTRGHYPHAVWRKPDGSEAPVTVWCGNDYLGMGQHPVVLDAMHEALDATGAGSGGTRNISGTNHYHVLLEQELADLHGKESALIFTSGYVSNWASLGTLGSKLPGCIIYSASDNHASMIEGIRHSRAEKRIWKHNSPEDLDRALSADDPGRPKIVAFESVYSMDGDIAPIAEIGAIAREYGILFHTDATQAVGHIPVDVQAMNIDILSMSAHKIYGPKGIGALYRRRSNPRVQLAPVMYGGGHEKGIRSGTLNVPGIVGFGEALRIAKRNMSKEVEKYREWTLQMQEQFEAELGDVYLNGHPTERLPHNLNISFSGVESRAVIVKLQDVAVATGSACTSAKVEPSHVIQALGCGDERAHTAIRVSVGRFNTDVEIDMSIDRIVSAVRELRRLSLSFA